MVPPAAHPPKPEDEMLWLKAFHIVFVVAWFAGLFYLPRLFVYHAETRDEPATRASSSWSGACSS